VIIINKGSIVADGPTNELLKGGFDSESFIIKIKTKDSCESIKNRLSGIEGVYGCEVFDGELKEISLNVARREGIEEKIYTSIKSTDWILYEFRKEIQTLEQIFKQLTMEED